MATVPRLQRYYQGATTSCSHMSFGLLFSPAGSAGACRGSCPPMWRSRRRTGAATDRGLDFHAGNPLSSLFAHGQEQDLPGSLATHPVTLRRSTTPDDPLRLAISGASGAAPTRLTMKASSFTDFEAARRFVTCCLRFTTGVTPTLSAPFRKCTKTAVVEVLVTSWHLLRYLFDSLSSSPPDGLGQALYPPCARHFQTDRSPTISRRR